MDLDFTQIGRDGALLALTASAIIMGALRLNPRLFLKHFPRAVKESQPPLSTAEKRTGLVVGVALIVLMFGVPVWSARVAALAHGYEQLEIFVHAFLVAMIFNVTDWLLLDELWIGRGRPEWALPRGVNIADVPFDHAQHARGFAVGAVFCAIVGGLATVVGLVL